MRQMAAIVASGDRAEELRNVRLPLLVIHGRADTLIGVSGGERTAELVPGANLVVLNDMGHDLPEPSVAGRSSTRSRATPSHAIG